MIKSENGTVELFGSGANLLTDLACIISAFKRSDFPKIIIMNTVETAFKFEESACIKNDSANLTEILSSLQDLLKKMEV